MSLRVLEKMRSAMEFEAIGVPGHQVVFEPEETEFLASCVVLQVAAARAR